MPSIPPDSKFKPSHSQAPYKAMPYDNEHGDVSAQIRRGWKAKKDDEEAVKRQIEITNKSISAQQDSKKIDDEIVSFVNESLKGAGRGNTQIPSAPVITSTITRTEVVTPSAPAVVPVPTRPFVGTVIPGQPNTYAAILVIDDPNVVSDPPVRWLTAPDSTNSYVPVVIAGAWEMRPFTSCGASSPGNPLI